MDGERTARYTTYRSIPIVRGIKHQGAIYPPGHPLPSVQDRQRIWTDAGVAPTNTPFEIRLPAEFDFGQYVWGTNGAEWEAVNRIAHIWHDQLSIVWAYQGPIPNGTPFIGEIPSSELARAPRILSLGYDDVFAIREPEIWAVWGMVCCWWVNYCRGKKKSLLRYLED